MNSLFPSINTCQERLDVIQKTRANLFNWRGQFTPELIEYLLSEYAATNDVVADPFSGSGTVLLESARCGLACIGLEINPAAYAMSQFYTLCNSNRAERIKILDAVENQMIEILKDRKSASRLEEDRTYRDGYKNLIDFARLYIPRLKRGIEKIVAFNVLFVCESRIGSDLVSSLHRTFVYVKEVALSLPISGSAINAFLSDARSLHTLPAPQPSLIITSPPYINVFNYHQNHRAIMESAGWDLLKVASSEFGSNRKNRGNRFKTVVQYCLDMELALRSFWHSLKSDGLAILIVGRESNVRGVPFYNGEIVQEIADGMRCFQAIGRHERKFVNKFGLIIKEDILLLRKRQVEPIDLDVRRIATNHLSSAFLIAGPEMRTGIASAIIDCGTVIPSPIFNMREARSVV